MAESIETFIERLRQDGVDQGKAEAERLREQAKGEAERIVQEAESRAKDIVATAEKEAERLRQRAHADLRMAARDTEARLRSRLESVLNAALAKRVDGELQDPQVLGKAIVAACGGTETETIEVPAGLEQAVGDALAKEVADGSWAAPRIEAGAEQPGFAYRLEGGRVEIDTTSVVEQLRDLVGESLLPVLFDDDKQEKDSDEANAE